MAATIKIKNSSTAGAAPTSSDLVQGELAVNVTDKRLFTENASGTIVELGTNPSVPVTFPDGSASAPSLTNEGDANTGLFFPAADTVGITTGGTERARIDSSGNLGLGVTPSAWKSTSKALQVNTTGGFSNDTTYGTSFSDNVYLNSGTQWIRLTGNGTTTGLSTVYGQVNGVHYWYNAPVGSAGTAATLTQAMTLDASGNLALGTTSAQQTSSNRTVFSLAGGSQGALMNFISSTARMGYVFGSTTDLEIAAEGSTVPMRFVTNGAERARIDSSGNLLVGCTSFPGAGTSTTGSAFGPGSVSVQRAAATPCYFGRSNDGEVMALYSGTTQRGQVSISGATTTYGSFSDYRLKENVTPIVGGLAKVMTLKPSTFNFIEFPEQTINGFIAHEVAEVEAIAVVGEKDAVNEDGNPLYQSVDAAKLVPLLTAAIQELKAIVDEQAAEIAALKGQA